MSRKHKHGTKTKPVFIRVPADLADWFEDRAKQLGLKKSVYGARIIRLARKAANVPRGTQGENISNLQS